MGAKEYGAPTGKMLCGFYNMGTLLPQQAYGNPHDPHPSCKKSPHKAVCENLIISVSPAGNLTLAAGSYHILELWMDAESKLVLVV